MSYEKRTVNKRSKVESEVDMRDVVVIDNGTDTIKIGMSGVDYPQIVIDTVTGLVEPNS
jgi:actin-related protein